MLFLSAIFQLGLRTAGTDQHKSNCYNGAAARLVAVGDRVIIMAFKYVDSMPENYRPTIILLNKNNEVV